MICEVLLQLIDKGDQGNVPLLVKKLHSILTIEDKYQALRISALLGLPQFLEAKTNHFCLSSSERSETTHYISGLFANKD